MQVSYIEKHGTPVEKACLAYLLNNTPASNNTIQALFANQRIDGGWPAKWSHKMSSLDATCFRLAQAESLGLTGSEKPIQAAMLYLMRCQSLDGSWDEDASLENWVPERLKPGALESRLYLTANCGFWMANYSGRSNSVPRAMGYLMRYLEESGCLPASHQANWMSAGLWLRMRRYEVANNVIAACKDQLENLPASDLAWMGVTLIIGRIQQKHPLIQATADKLLALRKPGNYWESEGGPAWNCQTTIEALRILTYCKRI